MWWAPLASPMFVVANYVIMLVTCNYKYLYIVMR